MAKLGAPLVALFLLVKREKRGEREEVAARPSLPSPNRTREGGRRPPFPSSPPLPSPLLLFQVGVLLPVGVGLPYWRAKAGRPAFPLLLYIRGQGGTPIHTS